MGSDQAAKKRHYREHRSQQIIRDLINRVEHLHAVPLPVQGATAVVDAQLVPRRIRRDLFGDPESGAYNFFTERSQAIGIGAELIFTALLGGERRGSMRVSVEDEVLEGIVEDLRSIPRWRRLKESDVRALVYKHHESLVGELDIVNYDTHDVYEVKARQAVRELTSRDPQLAKYARNQFFYPRMHHSLAVLLHGVGHLDGQRRPRTWRARVVRELAQTPKYGVLLPLSVWSAMHVARDSDKDVSLWHSQASGAGRGRSRIGSSLLYDLVKDPEAGCERVGLDVADFTCEYLMPTREVSVQGFSVKPFPIFRMRQRDFPSWVHQFCAEDVYPLLSRLDHEAGAILNQRGVLSVTPYSTKTRTGTLPF